MLAGSEWDLASPCRNTPHHAAKLPYPWQQLTRAWLPWSERSCRGQTVDAGGSSEQHTATEETDRNASVEIGKSLISDCPNYVFKNSRRAR